MPEIGGTKLAGDFRSMMADVRKAIDETKQSVRGAVKDLTTEIVEGGKATVRAIKEETTAVRDGYAELLGNQPHGEPAEQIEPPEPPKTNGGLPKAATIPAPEVPDRTFRQPH